MQVSWFSLQRTISQHQLWLFGGGWHTIWQRKEISNVSWNVSDVYFLLWDLFFTSRTSHDAWTANWNYMVCDACSSSSPLAQVLGIALTHRNWAHSLAKDSWMRRSGVKETARHSVQTVLCSLQVWDIRGHSRAVWCTEHSARRLHCKPVEETLGPEVLQVERGK